MRKLFCLLTILIGLFGFQIVADADEGYFNAHLVNVADTTSYLTIDAKSLDSPVTSLFLDGKKVAFSPVTTDGLIIKAEYDGVHKKAAIELADGRRIERSISFLYAAQPLKASQIIGAPELVWGHVTIPVWDFHTVAKDDNGVELMYPKETTFNVTDAAKAKEDIEEETFVSDEINDLDIDAYQLTSGKDIIISFDYSNTQDRSRFLRLSSIKAKTDDQAKALRFKKTKKGNKAMVIIPLEQNPIGQEKRFQLDIRFRGLPAKSLSVEMADAQENPNPAEVINDNQLDYGENLVLSFDLKNTLERNQFIRLYRLTKVWPDGHEEPLVYRKSGDGKIIVSFANSRPLHTRGKHKIKLIYRGLRPMYKDIHYKDKAPVIQWNSNNGAYVDGKDLLFTLKGFDYLFQQDTGVQSLWLNGIELKRRYVLNPGETMEDAIADGKTDAIENEEGNPFHVIGDLLRIKNDGVHALRPGINYLTVKYDTYHDSTFEFILKSKKPIAVQEPTKPRVSRRSVDVLSSASSGGTGNPSVGGDDSSGGSVNMGATLVYNFDMVANAWIIEALDYKNAGAKKVLDFWEGTAKEVAVLKDYPNRKVIWDSYMNYVKDQRQNHNTYCSFKAYHRHPAVDLTKNSPYQLKYVFGNGIGAPIFHLENLFKDKPPVAAEKKPVPKEALAKLDNIFIREDLILPRYLEWVANISSIEVNHRLLIENKDYKIDTSNAQLIIYGKNFPTKGMVPLKIIADGYDPYEKDILVKEEKDVDSRLTLLWDRYDNQTIKVGDPLYFDIESPMYVKASQVELISENGESKVLTPDQDYDYISSLGFLTVRGHVITKPGQYTARFHLIGRKSQDISFEVIDPNAQPLPEAPIEPTADWDEDEMAAQFPGMIFNANNQTFDNDGRFTNYHDWLNDIRQIQVNGQKVNFAPNGVLVDGPWLSQRLIRFYLPIERGDVINIYSNRYPLYQYLVR